MVALAKRVLLNAILAVVGFTLAFGAGEIIVRLLYKQETVLFPRYHTDYRYGRYSIRGIRPNAEFWHTSVDGKWKFVTNTRGFRNAKEFSYAKPANTMRVLTLGDSHTQGYEVRQEQTFSEALERILSYRKMPAEVINAGVSGFSTAEALVFLENEGVKYSPDAVVLGFFANDFEDNLKAGLFSLEGNGQLKDEKFEHLPGVRIQNAIYALPPMRWLGENSYFYSLLFNRIWDYFKAELAERTKQGARTTDSPRTIAAGPEYAIPTTNIRTQYDIALATALIERMHRVCTERGIRFIVVDIPVPSGRYRYASSLPPELETGLTALGVDLIPSRALFADFDGAAELHAPHGQRHISEFAHALIGVEIGRRLLVSDHGVKKR